VRRCLCSPTPDPGGPIELGSIVSAARSRFLRFRIVDRARGGRRLARRQGRSYGNGKKQLVGQCKGRLFKSFRRTGKVAATGDYREGKRAGCWETYYDNGDHESKGAYNAGEKVGSWLSWDRQQKKNREKFGGETAQGACLLML
jgi:hypothetical protein